MSIDFEINVPNPTRPRCVQGLDEDVVAKWILVYRYNMKGWHLNDIAKEMGITYNQVIEYDRSTRRAIRIYNKLKNSKIFDEIFGSRLDKELE